MGNSTSQAQRQQFLDLWNIVYHQSSSSVLGGPNTVLEPIFKTIGLDSVFAYHCPADVPSTILWFVGDAYKLLGYRIVLNATYDQQGTANAKQVITVNFCKASTTRQGIETISCVSHNRCTTLSAITRAIQGIIARNKVALKAAAESVQAEAQARLAQANLLIQTVEKL